DNTPRQVPSLETVDPTVSCLRAGLYEAGHTSACADRPPLRVKLDRSMSRPRSCHVRFALKADMRELTAVCPLSATSGCERSQQRASYSITSSARASSLSGTDKPSALAVLRLTTLSDDDVGTAGDGLCLSPACVPPGSTAAMPEERSPRSGASDRDGDELRRVIRLQQYQHGAFAILMGIDDGIAHIRRGRNFLPAHVEDDVAGLEAVFGCEPVGVDLGHAHSLGAAAGDLSCGSKHQAKLRYVGAGRARLGHGGTRFAFLRKFTDRQRDALLFALAPYRELHGRTGSHCTDLLGEITRVLDRIAVDGSDDIAREHPGFGGGAVRLRLGGRRGLGFFYSEAPRGGR